ncbi:MAG: NAD-dependent epimerase/dehydratase family protein [Candidatus Obscuribacter sp.]|nr:NAD-dependent epimerase/dehydratase family protein [Candidatus Obscuribacter sp.]
MSDGDQKRLVLVTGATGFLGRHLVPALLRRPEYHVVTFGRSAPDIRQPGAGHEHIVGSVENRQDVERAFALKPQLVFHMAGLVSYRHSDAQRQREVNVEGTRHVMELALSAGSERVVHTSSIAALGVPAVQGEIADEGLAYNLAGLRLSYCDTKHEAEMVVLENFRRGLNVVMLNPGIIFGEGDSHGHHHAIFRAMSRGGLLAVPSGGIPFSDIVDVVDAHLAAIEKGRAGERYSLVSANLSFMEAAEIFASLYRTEPPRFVYPDLLVKSLGALAESISEVSKRLGLPLRFSLTRQQAWLSCRKIFFSNEKACRELGFLPTPFAETIKRTAPYYLAR